MSSQIKPNKADLDIGKDVDARVGVEIYKGNAMIFAREMYRDPNDNELRFGKNGINIKFEYAEALIDALISAYNRATDRGLYLAMEDGTPYDDPA